MKMVPFLFAAALLTALFPQQACNIRAHRAKPLHDQRDLLPRGNLEIPELREDAQAFGFTVQRFERNDAPARGGAASTTIPRQLSNSARQR